MPLFLSARYCVLTGLLSAIGFVLAGCLAKTSEPQKNSSAVSHISSERLLENISTLASDEFGGRLPGTEGETKTTQFLTDSFKDIGLAPGNPNGSYLQEVPLVGITSQPELQIISTGEDMNLTWRQDYVATSPRFSETVSVKDSPLVFVGYGVQAPEYNWDDIKGMDLRGKTLVMLINDPAIVDPANPDELDPTQFGGEAMTYYGRWTYKYEMGAKLGADAVIIVHETAPAAYGWNVVESSWTGEAFELADANQNRDRVPLQAWITKAQATKLFRDSGYLFEDLKQLALSRDFQPKPLRATLNATIRNDLREITSNNVIGLLPGADPDMRDEYIVYSAHWDHLGTNTDLEGDQIYNGAVDNATGVAGLLEMAHAFHSANPPSPRSIVFLAVTAEEQGLLGSRFYGENPLYPLNKTLANLNLESLNVWGPSPSIEVIGYGQNSLESILKASATVAGQYVVPDTAPERGLYYRSDQFNFARQGVPALFAGTALTMTELPGPRGKTRRIDYTEKHYHSVDDEVSEDWDLRGAVQVLERYYDVGMAVSENPQYPTWSPQSEFRSIRER